MAKVAVGQESRVGGEEQDSAWSAGALSMAHHDLEENCEACHVTPFVSVQDETCLTCHEELGDHAEMPRLAEGMAPLSTGDAIQWSIGEALGKEGPLGKNYNMRWIASMVADVHRILTRGGVFMYPRDAREPEKPGKLRLMYEANPMSFIIEQAGGAATNGTQRILDIKPENLHQRVAVFLGSKQEVERITGYHEE